MKTELLLDYKTIPHGQERKLYILLRVRSDMLITNNENRIPLNISVVIDRSGSMAGDKISFVKKAAQFLVQHLTSADWFSLVSYNHDVTVNAKAQKIENKDRLIQAIEKLIPGGTTNLSGGWLQGCQLVVDQAQSRQITRVLLLTDGIANKGVTDNTRLAEMARQKRDEGIVTTTMGVGTDFNEDLLTQMSSEGGGAFYFIDNPDRAPEIFAEELRDLLSVVAQNLKVTFTPASFVQDYAQFNAYAVEDNLTSKTYRLGDVYGEDLKELVLEVVLPAQTEVGEISLGTIRVAYDDVSESQIAHHSADYEIKLQVVEADAFDEVAHEGVMRTVLLLETARARDKAIKAADKGDFRTAQAVLTAMADRIQESPYFDEEDFQIEHNALREEAIDMELGEERYDAMSRKSSTTKAFGRLTTSSSQIFGRRRSNETVVVQGRLRSSRRALERHGLTPRIIKWKREQLVLDAQLIRIGRGASNDIVIPEDEVSEHHCQIIKQGDAYYLEDLRSANGTFANGGKVEDRFRLSVGDIMTVGSWLFMFDS